MNKNDPNKQLDWANILFLTLSPIAALVGGILYTQKYGVTWQELTLFTIMYFATGMSITGGYHRLFSHVSYVAHPFVKMFYLIFGACAMQNSVLHWSADHRVHHRFTDTDLDPYNAGRGFWWSHIGWIFYTSPETRDFSVVSDLLKDKWVMWQHKYHVTIAMVVGFGLPALIGLYFDRPFGFVLWGGIIRVVAVHHTTFFINSLAHMWGTQPFSRSDSSVNSWWLAFLTNGEGYHNFHHRFPSDYRNGIAWYQWDPTKWLIRGLNYFNFTDRLHRVPEHLILRARMEVEALDAEAKLKALSTDHHAEWKSRLETARKRFEETLTQWAEHRTKYWEAKKETFKNSEQLAHYKEKLLGYEQAFKEARNSWKASLRGLNSIPTA